MHATLNQHVGKLFDSRVVDRPVLRERSDDRRDNPTQLLNLDLFVSKWAAAGPRLNFLRELDPQDCRLSAG